MEGSNEQEQQLQSQGLSGAQLPALSTLALILNRMVIDCERSLKPNHKKLPETDAIDDNIKVKDHKSDNGSVKRLSLDCQAIVN